MSSKYSSKYDDKTYYKLIFLHLGCLPPPSITTGSGTITPSKTVYAVGDIVTYECTSPTVYILTGSSTTEWQANGEFSPLTAPTCDQGNHLLKKNVSRFEPESVKNYTLGNITFPSYQVNLFGIDT